MTSTTRMGRVYLIGAAAADLIKIGWTASDADSRMRALQTGTTNTLAVLTSFEGTPTDEHTLHLLLAEYRVRGEWFRLPPSVVSAGLAALSFAAFSEVIDPGGHRARDLRGLCTSCGVEPRIVGDQRWCRSCHAEAARRTRPGHSDLPEEERKRAVCRSYSKQLVKRGAIPREACRVCGAKAQIHHLDYSDPRAIEWLCRPHLLAAVKVERGEAVVMACVTCATKAPGQRRRGMCFPCYMRAIRGHTRARACAACGNADMRVLRRHRLVTGMVTLCSNDSAIAGRRLITIEQLRAEIGPAHESRCMCNVDRRGAA